MLSVPLIPRRVLFGNPTHLNPQVSPNGTRWAYIAPIDNVLNVWVKTVGESDARPVTRDGDRGVIHYSWAYDNEHILYIQDTGGDENFHIYAVSLKTGETRDLTPFENVQAQLMKRDRHHPEEVLINLNRRDVRCHDVYRVNIITGEMRCVAENPGNIVGWDVDSQFRVRLGQAALPDNSMDLLYRDTEDGEWRTIRHWDHEDALSSGVRGFSKDGRSLYIVESLDANAARLVKLDITSGRIDVMAQDPQFDVGYVMQHPDSYEIQALSFYRSRNEWKVLDDSIEVDFQRLAQVEDGDFYVCSRTIADDIWFVAYNRDNGPVNYYVYFRKTGSTHFLFANQPELSEYRLSHMHPICFTASDGLEIHGYITFPSDVIRENLPMVVNVHGGPFHRDRWGLNPEAQWLANRGYICLQVNFRGSTGYGKDFINASTREWGGKMHQDLVDAVNWAIKQRYADPDRVAIYGGSYGGYAALVGATFTPDLFRCAIDVVGPSNLVTFINSIPPYWSMLKSMLTTRVGDPDTEPEFLQSRSPLFHVTNIRIPMLIAQGANDPRVKQAESEQIVHAMKEKGIDYEYLLFEDEGHGFVKPENRLRFYAAAEKFLAKHLGGRSE